jgi:TolA-binding protein
MNDRELIERLLQGRLSEHESAEATRRILADSSLRRLLEQEAVLESQLCSQSLAHEPVSGLSAETDWDDLAAVSAASGEKGCGAMLTDEEWRRMIATAVETTPRSAKLTRFPGKTAFRYLAAAGIVLAAGTAMYLWKETARELRNDHSSSPVVAVSSPFSTPWYGELEVFHIDTKGDSIITSEANPGIVSIAPQTAAVAEQHTAIGCTEYRDTAITLDMESGTALFSVEKGRYRYFKVLTPFTEITVTGTIFKVSIDTVRCQVSVERGSVSVRHLANGMIATVLPGQAVEADSDTLIAIRIEQGLSDLVARKKLLADFLEASSAPRNGTARRMDHLPADPVRDSILQRFSTAIAENAPGNDSSVEAYVAGHATDTNAGLLLLDMSRLYESRGKWLMAAHLLNKFDDMPLAGTNGLAETALYRKGRFYLQAGDTSAALAAFTRFETEFPQSAWQQDIVDLHIQILRSRKAPDIADTLLVLLAPALKHRIADRTIISHADDLREHGRFDRARFWYETVVTDYPESRFRGDAMYWAGWCMVQQNILNREKRAFNHK